jgi:hypothetical protein
MKRAIAVLLGVLAWAVGMSHGAYARADEATCVRAVPAAFAGGSVVRGQGVTFHQLEGWWFKAYAIPGGSVVKLANMPIRGGSGDDLGTTDSRRMTQGQVRVTLLGVARPPTTLRRAACPGLPRFALPDFTVHAEGIPFDHAYARRYARAGRRVFSVDVDLGPGRATRGGVELANRVMSALRLR